GCNAQNRKDIRTHELAVEPLRLSSARQIDIQWSICAERFERLVLVTKIEEVRGRRLVLLYAECRRVFPDGDESFRIFQRQRPEQDRINRTENRGIHPNPQ